GPCHLTYRWWALRGTPSPPIYVRLKGEEMREATREFVDRACGTNPWGITLDPDGDPIVIYERPAGDGWTELVAARRGPGGWSRAVALARVPRELHRYSPPTCDREGRVRVAFTRGGPQVYLVSGAGEHWQSEEVRIGPPRNESSRESWSHPVAVLLDSNQR